MKNTQNLLLKFIKILLFVAAVMPLVVSLETNVFPFVVPKVLFFRGIVFFALLLYLFLLWKDNQYLPKKNTLLFATGIFVVIAIISAFVGSDPHNSWWGDFERMDSVYTLLSFFLYLVLLVSIFKEKKEWRWFLNVLLSVSVLVIFTGVIQRFASADDPFLTIGGSKRVYGTLGNFIYFGHYSLFSFWLGVLAYFLAEKKYQKLIYAGISGLSIFGMFLSASRGPLLAWMMSLILFGTVSIFISKNKYYKIFGLLGAICITTIIILAIFGHNAFIEKLPGIRGLGEISTMSGTADTRLMAWDIAWKGFLEKPFFGWGWFNYYVIFNKHYNPKYLEHGWSETWFDHAHNQYFDVLSTTGIFGFVAYLSIFVALIYLLIILLRKKSIDKWFFWAAISLALAHLINNFFVFEDLSSYLLLFSFLAIILGIFQTDNKNNENKINPKSNTMLKPLIFIFILLSLYLQYYGNYLSYKQNKIDYKLQVEFIEDPVNAVPKMVEAIEKNVGPHTRDLRNDFAQKISNLERVPENSPQIELYRSYVQYAVDMLEENAKEYPLDTRRKILLVQLYKDLLLSGDNSVIQRMEDLFQDLSELSPDRQQVYYYWAELKLFEGDYDRAVELVKKTIEDNPNVSNGYWFLSKIEGSRSDWKEAKKYLDLAVEKGFSPDQNEKAMVDYILEQSASL